MVALALDLLLRYWGKVQYNNTHSLPIYRRKYQHETHGQFASDAARSAGQGSHIGNQCSPGCPFLLYIPTLVQPNVRPICLVCLIESHAPLLRFAFAIFSVFLLPEKNLSQSHRDGPFSKPFYLLGYRLGLRFVRLKEICLGNLLPFLKSLSIKETLIY